MTDAKFNLGPGLTRRQVVLLSRIPAARPGVICTNSRQRRALSKCGLIEYNHGTRCWRATAEGAAVLRAYRLRGWIGERP